MFSILWNSYSHFLKLACPVRVSVPLVIKPKNFRKLLNSYYLLYYHFAIEHANVIFLWFGMGYPHFIRNITEKCAY